MKSVGDEKTFRCRSKTSFTSFDRVRGGRIEGWLPNALRAASMRRADHSSFDIASAAPLHKELLMARQIVEA
jgi:hypothetical protein